MRFIVLVKATKLSEQGVMPSEKMLSEMGKFNEELQNAGMLLDGSGLKPSSQGLRVKYSNGKRTFVDGPFTEAKELVAGYWLIQANSLQEVKDWMKRAPMDADPEISPEAEIEIRPLYEFEDFGPSEAIEKMRDLNLSGKRVTP